MAHRSRKEARWRLVDYCAAPSQPESRGTPRAVPLLPRAAEHGVGTAAPVTGPADGLSHAGRAKHGPRNPERLERSRRGLAPRSLLSAEAKQERQRSLCGFRRAAICICGCRKAAEVESGVASAGVAG